MRKKTDKQSGAIFVRATAAGAGGIATLILDGEHVRELLQPVFVSKRKLMALNSGDVALGRIIDANEQVIDEVLVALISEKDSETGNLQLELSCHGGAGTLTAVEAALRGCDFEPGRPTELLERAHLAARLSLLAIEARLRLAHAATARQAEFLLGHKQLQQQWERLGLDAGLAMRDASSAWRETMFSAAEEAARQFPAAAALLARHHIAVVGPVNAGKSALVAALARAEVHLISEIAGTTLDRLDMHLAICGLDCVLSDTAGLRETRDDVEREGQRRALDAARTAQLSLIVFDGSVAPADREIETLTRAPYGGKRIVVLNKQDLGQNENAVGVGFAFGCDTVAVSAKTGAGLTDLEAALERALIGGPLPPAAPFTQRQAQHLENIKTALRDGARGIDVLAHLRKLVGMRPDAEELGAVLDEAAADVQKMG